MKKFFKAICIYFALFILSFNLQAAADDAPCGMEVGDSGYVVQKESFEICENDISMNILYVMFHQVFEDDRVKEMLGDSIVINEETKAFAYSTGIGDTLMAIFNAITNIVISIATLLISYSVINVVYRTQTNGEFMGNKQSKAFPVIFNNMFIILLITPIGSMLVIQILILLIAVLSIMLGNYFWSTFLHATEVKTTQAELNKEKTIYDAEVAASELITTVACMERTNQNILNKRYAGDNSYHDGVAWTNREIKKTLPIIHHCLQYYATPIIDEFNMVTSYNFNRPNISNCAGLNPANGIVSGISSAFAYDYQEEDHGLEHKCGSITYKNPDLKNMFPQTSTSGLMSAGDERDVINSLRNKISTGSEFNSFENQVKSKVTNFVTNGINDNSKLALYNSYDPIVAEIEEKVYNIIEIPEQYEDDKKLSGKALYLQANVLLNQYLGSKYVEYNGAMSDIADAYLKYHPIFEANDDFHHKQLDTEVSNGNAKMIEEEKYGVENLINKAKESYDYFEQAHCAKNWINLENSRKTSLYFNEAGGNDYEEASAAVGVLNFECLKLRDKKGDIKLKYNIENASDSDIYKGMTVTGNSIEYVRDDEITIKNKLENDIYAENIKNALIEKFVLEGYIYSVKMGVSKALTKKLKEFDDDSLLEKIREEGWATGGSMMLKITMDQGNASVFKSGIAASGYVVSDVASFEEGETYVNASALESLLKNEDEEEIEEENTEKDLKPFDLSTFLYTGGKSINTQDRLKIEQSKQSEESAEMDSIMGHVENTLFSPIIYIKQASGMERDLDLSTNLEKCRMENKVCVSQDTHPLNALMMFGQELLANALSLLILDVVVQSLLLVLEKVTSSKTEVGTTESSKISKILNSIKGFFTGPIKVIVLILKAVGIFFDMIRPILFMFVLAGVFLGFIMPTIPYISFAIVFLGWIISIFQMLIVAPIYVLLAAVNGNEKKQLSFMKFWELTGGILLKPALLTIAIIFGWTLSSISLYYINSTVYSLFAATSPDSILLNIFFKGMTYLIYITLVYIVIYHSFKVINKLPDEILSLLNVRGSGDSQFIESLGAEKLVQAKVGQDLVQQAHGASSGKIAQSRKYNRELQTKMEEIAKREEQNNQS